MSPLEIKKLVAVLVAAYPASKVTPESVGIYERMLADLDYPAANAAVEQLLATSKWLPTVAEIRERVASLAIGGVRAGGEGWGDVLKAIGRYGRNRVPGVDFEFADPVVLACVRAFGWRELCDSENPQADRARFVELYDKLASQRRTSELTAGLPATQRYRALSAVMREDSRMTSARSIGELLQLPAAGAEVKP